MEKNTETTVPQGARNFIKLMSTTKFSIDVSFSRWHDSLYEFDRLLFYNSGNEESIKFLKAVKHKNPSQEHDNRVEFHIALYTTKGILDDPASVTSIQDIKVKMSNPPVTGFRFIHIHYSPLEPHDFSESAYKKYVKDKWGGGPIRQRMDDNKPDTNNGGIIIKG